MTNHARHCKICGQQFGHAWGGVGLAAHMWNEHGVPSQAGFNGKTVSYGPEGKKIEDKTTSESGTRRVTEKPKVVYDKTIETNKPMSNFPFNEAMNAPTIEEGIAILYAEERTEEEWEELAWCFAFNNGSSHIPPTEREDALAAACLDKLEEMEGLI